MKSRLLHTCALAICAALLGMSEASWAADTVETWDVGATDVESYIGMDGLGRHKEARSYYGDMMLGYGLVDRFSAYLGTSLAAVGGLASGFSTQYFGIFGTPLDSDHLDVDLFFDMSSGGPEQRLEVRPALELNVDADPEMQTWGVYLRAPLPVYGQKFKTGAAHTSFHLESTLGAYAHLATSHQFLVEYVMEYHPDPAQGERRTTIGGVSVGYNVVLSDSIELINEVFLDIPQGDEKTAGALMTGFIATLPSPGSKTP